MKVEPPPNNPQKTTQKTPKEPRRLIEIRDHSNSHTAPRSLPVPRVPVHTILCINVQCTSRTSPRMVEGGAIRFRKMHYTVPETRREPSKKSIEGM